MKKSLHAVLVKVFTSGGEPLFYSYYDSFSAETMFPMQSIFHWLKRWKSEAAKSGLYSGCGRTAQSRSTMCSTVFKLVWDLEIMCCKRKAVIFSGLTLEVQVFSIVSSFWPCISIRGTHLAQTAIFQGYHYLFPTHWSWYSAPYTVPWS